MYRRVDNTIGNRYINAYGIRPLKSGPKALYRLGTLKTVTGKLTMKAMTSHIIGYLSYTIAIAQPRAPVENSENDQSGRASITGPRIRRRLRRLVFFYREWRRHRFSHRMSLLMAWDLSRLCPPANK